MELLRWKTRISMLWMIMVINYLLLMSLNLQASGGTGGGEMPTFRQVIVAFIPFIMAWLTLTLKDSANRWTNLVLGILFAIMFITIVILALAGGGGEAATPLTTIFAGSAMILLPLVASLLIIWYAWKWPKQVA
jgi:hypothetical protein